MRGLDEPAASLVPAAFVALGLALAACSATTSDSGHHAGPPGTATTVPKASFTTAPATALAPASTQGPQATTSSVANGAGNATARAASGGLTVTLTALRSRAASGATIEFTVTARAAHAPGALSYQLAYGDGGMDQNVVPQFCRSGVAPPADQTWHTSHAYARPGRWKVTALVRANCTPDRVAASVTVASG